MFHMEFITTFKTTLSATVQIFLMGSCGYFLVKRKVINDNGLVILSRLVISLFFPLFTFHQLTNHFSFSVYQNWWIFPLISFGVTLGGFLIGWLTAQCFKNIPFQKEFIALTGFQNSGFIPLMLVATMFTGELAQKLYIYIFLFLVGFDLVMWSFGVWFLTKSKSAKFDLTNLLYSPFTAIVISLLLVLFGWNQAIPEVLKTPIKMFGDCALPMAVFVVGGNLAMIDIFSSNQREIILAMLSKLVFFPLLAFLFVLTFHIDKFIGFLIILQAAVPSANSLSVIARRHQIDDQFLNQGIFFTNIASIITLPVFLTLYMQLVSFY